MAAINTPTSTMRNLKSAIQAYLDASDAGDIVGSDGLKDSDEAVVPTYWSPMSYAQARTRGGRAISYFEYYMGSDREATRLTDLRGDMLIDDGIALIEAREHASSDMRRRWRDAVVDMYPFLLAYLYGDMGLTAVMKESAPDEAEMFTIVRLESYDGAAARFAGTYTTEGYIDRLSIDWDSANMETIGDLLAPGELTIYRSAYEGDSGVAYSYIPIYDGNNLAFSIDARYGFGEGQGGITGFILPTGSLAARLDDDDVHFSEEGIESRVLDLTIRANENVALMARFGFPEGTSAIGAPDSMSDIDTAVLAIAQQISQEQYNLILSFNNVPSRKYEPEDVTAIVDPPRDQSSLSFLNSVTPFAQELLFANNFTRADQAQAIAQKYTEASDTVATDGSDAGSPSMSGFGYS
tara:strand:+ start:872 stop:2098 length:1227 start_codon:yes stop_codon:yes gene_type:complete